MTISIAKVECQMTWSDDKKSIHVQLLQPDMETVVHFKIMRGSIKPLIGTLTRMLEKEKVST